MGGARPTLKSIIFYIFSCEKGYSNAIIIRNNIRKGFFNFSESGENLFTVSGATQGMS